jgi:hypothetical protein
MAQHRVIFYRVMVYMQSLPWNVKCVIFTAAVAGGYWYLPPKNIGVLALLLWLPYVALAWYDYAYECRFKMQPTVFPFGRWIFLPFKPLGYKNAFESLPDDRKATIKRVDHIAAWTVLVVLVASAWTVFAT